MRASSSGRLQLLSRRCTYMYLLIVSLSLSLYISGFSLSLYFSLLFPMYYTFLVSPYSSLPCPPQRTEQKRTSDENTNRACSLFIRARRRVRAEGLHRGTVGPPLFGIHAPMISCVLRCHISQERFHHFPCPPWSGPRSPGPHGDAFSSLATGCWQLPRTLLPAGPRSMRLGGGLFRRLTKY